MSPHGMKERELRAAATCALCQQPIMKSGLPLFWRVTIERQGVLMNAVNRQAGLEMLLGGAARLAQVMGPDEDMTSRVMDPATITVCETCCTQSTCVAALAELATSKEGS